MTTPRRPVGPDRPISRRALLAGGAATGAGLLVGGAAPAAADAPPPGPGPDAPRPDAPRPGRLVAPRPADALDLAPARWVWYPSERTLQNTFVLFRRTLRLDAAPARARGWILADSRYLLTVNGRRVQFGPAPADPRWPEADPLDLAPYLRAGENVIGATVLYYGQGDGTWPGGKPGFLFRLDVEGAGAARQVTSDASWRAHLARSWRPGQYKRWYLRALQEEFDARRHPHGWDRPGFAEDADWLPAMEIAGRADRPSVCHAYADYLFDTGATHPEETAIRPRSVPLLREDELVPAAALREAHRVRWRRPAEEWFESLTPGAFEAEPMAPAPPPAGPGAWEFAQAADRATALTFEFERQLVGWPRFTVEAPAGTTVELMAHEAHRPGGPPLLNTHLHAWSRFVARGAEVAGGPEAFEAFDFESLRWLQLHVRGPAGRVRVSGVGVRRRVFPWPRAARAETSDAAVNAVADAALRTLDNAAQDAVVDGMGRERQQYSGDVGHQLHLIHQARGEARLPARYLRTFSQGLTLDGYFLDCWPAYDRLARLPQRQLGLTPWGPLLDHGVGFVFDAWHHHLYAGDRGALAEVYPRLARFFGYLGALRGADGLLPVEDLGAPVVWVDNAYPRQRHKQCAFNLYAAAMAEHALAPLARAAGDAAGAEAAARFGRLVRAAAVRRFWRDADGLFAANRPWLAEEDGAVRTDDRALATAVLFGQCPGGRDAAAVAALVAPPPGMVPSYPANTVWRYWALAAAGRADVVVDEIRTRWAALPSVRLNGTLQEHWEVEPDSRAQWSHCPVSPLVALYTAVAGVMPTAAGFSAYRVRPQPSQLERLAVTSHTPHGPLAIETTGPRGGRELRLRTPPGAAGVLVLDARERVALAAAGRRGGLAEYRLPAGAEVRLRLAHT